MLTAWPGPAWSQRPWQVTPYLGGWVSPGVVQSEVVNGSRVDRRQVGQLIAGGRIGVALSPAVAIEATLGVGPSQVARTDSVSTADIPGFAMLGSARVGWLLPLARDIAGHLGVGFGVLRRSGRGWTGTLVAPALLGAVGVQTGIAPGSAFRAELEVFAFRGQRASPGPDPPGRPWRADVVASFGVVLSPLLR
jgi:hypothetical protein